MTLLNQSQFAHHIGRHRSYVTELKSKGLLVFRAGLVDVEKSLELMDSMKDPSKQAVADRHAENRQKQAVASQEDPTAANDTAIASFQTNKAKKAHYDALAAQRDFELSIGKLIVATDAAKAVSDAAAVARQRLESLPDVLAPQFAAETSEQRIRATLQDQIEALLSEMSRQFYKLAN